MRGVHPLWVLIAVVVLIGGAVAWNESRRALNEARAEGAPASAAQVTEPSATSVEPATSAPPSVPAEPSAAVVDLAPEIVRARALVLDRLKDPDSAQFRNERLLERGETICLEVNAKNAFGGYTGFSHAVVISGASGAPAVVVDSDPRGIAHALCTDAAG